MTTWEIHFLRPGNSRFLTAKYAFDLRHRYIVSGNVIQQDGPVKTGVVDDDKLIFEIVGNPVPL